jgi:hypothetical protein
MNLFPHYNAPCGKTGLNSYKNKSHHPDISSASSWSGGLFVLIETANAQEAILGAPRIGELLLKIIDFLLSIFGIIAIIGIVVSSLLYFFAGGNQRVLDIAKRSFRYSVMGIILTLGIMLLVRLVGGFLN